jgi:enediyne biosynthesis protein E4
VVNCVNAGPQLLRCDADAATQKRSWIKIRLVGVKSNRTGIGAKIKVVAHTGSPVLNAKVDASAALPPLNHPTDKDPSAGAPALVQIEEVRSSNGYYSASDLRMHFGLNDAKKVDLVEIRWPSGAVDTLKDLDVNRLYVVQEGGKVLKSDVLTPAKKKG